MSLELRILLIIASIITVVVLLTKIRRAKCQIHDGIFWFLLSMFFVVLSVFPQIADHASYLLGIESTVNLVFLAILAILLVKVFLLSVKVSMLEYKLVELAQSVAIESAEAKKKEKREEP